MPAETKKFESYSVQGQMEASKTCPELPTATEWQERKGFLQLVHSFKITVQILLYKYHSCPSSQLSTTSAARLLEPISSITQMPEENCHFSSRSLQQSYLGATSCTTEKCPADFAFTLTILHLLLQERSKAISLPQHTAQSHLAYNADPAISTCVFHAISI